MDKRRMIGKAECLWTSASVLDGFSWSEMGVVKIRNSRKQLQNKIIARSTDDGGKTFRVLRANEISREIRNTPAFRPWRLATFAQAQRIISGEIPTIRGPGLAMGLRDFDGYVRH